LFLFASSRFSFPFSLQNFLLKTTQSDRFAFLQCADITFSSKGKLLSGDACKNTTGLTAAYVQTATTTTPANTSSTAASAASATTSKSAAAETLAARGVGALVAAIAVGIAGSLL
jgi:hypothetical protein